jgi:hypothetical protein
VAVEKRLAKEYPNKLPPAHPLTCSVPGKILTHALWQAGLCTSQGGVRASRQRTRKKTFVSSRMVPQHQFNKVDDNVDVKAAKMDDAEVPILLWDERLINTYPVASVMNTTSRTEVYWSLDVLRSFFLRIWMRRIRHSFLRYLKITWPQFNITMKPELHNPNEESNEFFKDIVAGRDCITYSTRCTWWEWKGGSRLFFWRWVNEFKLHARDGIPICWLPNKQPTSKKLQPPVKDKIVKQQMITKLNKVRHKGYVKPGFVRSLIKFFSVPKGSSG